MDGTDYLSGPIRTSEEAWDRIHGELRTAGIKYQDASEGVQKLRERAELGSHWYDIIARTRSALEDEAGVAFQAVIADEVRALADERDTARSAVDDLQWKLDEERNARQIERDTGAKVIGQRDRLYSEKCSLKSEVEELQQANDRLEKTLDEDGEALRAKDDEIERLNDALRDANSKASLRRTLIDIVKKQREQLRGELNEAREEAAAEGMSRRQAENTLAEIQDEVDAPPPFPRSRIKSILDRHYGRHDDSSPDNGFSTIPPNLGSPSLANGHRVRVVSSESGVGHKGERGVVESVSDESIGYPFRVRFDDGDWRDYRRDELERV